MSRINDAIERIKILECPTGSLENRVANILLDYEVANKNEIRVNRDERFDKDGVQGYSAKISPDSEKSIVILAKSGLDDYVARVMDVYLG